MLREMMPVARRVLGDNHDLPLQMIRVYAAALCSVEDMWEAVTTLEEAARTARRVLGGAHPTTTGIERSLRDARAALCARETMASDEDDEILCEELAKALGCTVEELDGY